MFEKSKVTGVFLFALARIETVYGEGPIRFPCHRLLLEASAFSPFWCGVLSWENPPFQKFKNDFAILKQSRPQELTPIEILIKHYKLSSPKMHCLFLSLEGESSLHYHARQIHQRNYSINLNELFGRTLTSNMKIDLA